MGLGISILFLGLALRRVDWGEVAGHLGRANLLYLLGATGLATATFPLRAVRWRLILRDVDGHRFPWLPLWHATAVGFMANNLLPARAGELARAYMAKHQLGTRFTTAVASIGVERVLDGLTVVGLLTLAFVAPSFPRDARVGGARLASVATGAALLFGAALVLALIVVHRPAPWLALFRRGAGAALPARVADRLTHFAEGLVAGLTVLKSPARFAAVMGWSVVLWTVNAASFWLCYHAFAIDSPAESALVLQGLIVFGVAIPSAPGFWGVLELVVRETLGLYGVAADHAVSYALGYHLFTFIPITLLGLYSLSRAHVRLGELRGVAPAED